MTCSRARAGAGCELCNAELCPVAGIKLPAAQALGPLLRGMPGIRLPIDAPADHRTFREIVYTEDDEVGYLSFDFYNGAMSTSQCYRLRGAFLHARSRPTNVIVLQGGADFWWNSINFNVIEASVDPATESWRKPVVQCWHRSPTISMQGLGRFRAADCRASKRVILAR